MATDWTKSIFYDRGSDCIKHNSGTWRILFILLCPELHKISDSCLICCLISAGGLVPLAFPFSGWSGARPREWLRPRLIRKDGQNNSRGAAEEAAQPPTCQPTALTKSRRQQLSKTGHIKKKALITCRGISTFIRHYADEADLPQSGAMGLT